MGLQRKLARTNQIQIPLFEKARVIDVLTHIKKSYPELPFPEETLLVVVNHKLATMEKILKHNDNVIFLPFLGGG
jgi:molybdopterin converting factor small subunit